MLKGKNSKKLDYMLRSRGADGGRQFAKEGRDSETTRL